MNILLSELHPNVKTLASRYIDAKHIGKDVIEVQSLDSIEKRFLTRNQISYSYNSEDNCWEISIN